MVLEVMIVVIHGECTWGSHTRFRGPDNTWFHSLCVSYVAVFRSLSGNA